MWINCRGRSLEDSVDSIVNYLLPSNTTGAFRLSECSNELGSGNGILFILSSVAENCVFSEHHISDFDLISTGRGGRLRQPLGRGVVLLAAVLVLVRPIVAPFACYSCMSKVAEPFWSVALQHRFIRPLMFTKRCDGTSSPDEVDDGDESRSVSGSGRRTTSVPLQTCATFCLTMVMQLKVADIPLDAIYVRGCATNIARHGFRNQTFHFLDQIANRRCVKMGTHSVFNGYYSGRGESDSRMRSVPPNTEPVTLCSCWGDRCNWQSAVNGAAVDKRGRVALPFAAVVAVFLHSCVVFWSGRGWRLM